MRNMSYMSEIMNSRRLQGARGGVGGGGVEALEDMLHGGNGQTPRAAGAEDDRPEAGQSGYWSACRGCGGASAGGHAPNIVDQATCGGNLYCH